MAARTKNNNSGIFAEPFAFNQIKRSVIRPVSGLSLPMELPTGFSALDAKDGGIAAETVILTKERMNEARRGLIASANKLYASGYEPDCFVLNISAGACVDERFIKDCLSELCGVAADLRCSLSVGNAGRLLSETEEVIISIFTTGNRLKDIRLIPFQKKAAVLFAGYLAEEETSFLAKHFRKKILDRIPEYTVKAAINMNTGRSLNKTARIMHKEGIIKAVSLGSCGLMAALYNLSDEMKAGIRVEMARIPIHQESIEICEILKENPYELCSNGSVLIVTNRAQELKKALSAHNIRTQIIADLDVEKTTRELVWGDRIGYLDRP